MSRVSAAKGGRPFVVDSNFGDHWVLCGAFWTVAPPWAPNLNLNVSWIGQGLSTLVDCVVPLQYRPRCEMLGPAVVHNANLPSVHALKTRAAIVHGDFGWWFFPCDLVHHNVLLAFHVGLVCGDNQEDQFHVHKHLAGIWEQADIGIDAVPAFDFPPPEEHNPLTWVGLVLVVVGAALLLPQMLRGRVY